MILDNVRNINRYATLPALLKRGLRLLGRFNKDAPTGTIFYKEGIKAIVSNYKTKLKDDGVFESHRKYIDIQFLLEGKEMIRWSSLEGLSVCSRYSPGKDITLYNSSQKTSSIIMDKGIFAIFFPEDAHNPGLSLDLRGSKVKKVVIKVPV
jgi:biofilm protein TabA